MLWRFLLQGLTLLSAGKTILIISISKILTSNSEFFKSCQHTILVQIQSLQKDLLIVTKCKTDFLKLYYLYTV